MTESDAEPTMQELTEQQCQALLATHQVGRLGVNAEHYPLIFVVNYGLDRGVVIIRTHPGTKLRYADHANVTFEVDDIDQHTRSGWSVLIRGLAEEVTTAHRTELVQRTKASAVEPWAPGDYGHWLRLIPHRITGRRIIPGQLPPPFPDEAYL
jgi:nitroimidazol reductase NimA-like FMN-containing flavoprotein (pyridoxamine 5'-phosphate oxidase superfamily)